jgi:hypothetical protein
VTYEVTGVTVNGKRFKIRTSNRMHAYGINLYRGTVWERLSNGHRRILRRVWN